jgi:hypothetical protein
MRATFQKKGLEALKNDLKYNEQRFIIQFALCKKKLKMCLSRTCLLSGFTLMHQFS